MTKFYNYNNKTLCLKDWAKELGISYDTIRKRMYKGYTFEESVSNNFYEMMRDKNNYSSKHKGVCYHKGHKKWEAYIYKNCEKFLIGSYLTEEEAIKEYENYLKKEVYNNEKD